MVQVDDETKWLLDIQDYIRKQGEKILSHLQFESMNQATKISPLNSVKKTVTNLNQARLAKQIWPMKEWSFDEFKNFLSVKIGCHFNSFYQIIFNYLYLFQRSHLMATMVGKNILQIEAMKVKVIVYLFTANFLC